MCIIYKIQKAAPRSGTIFKRPQNSNCKPSNISGSDFRQNANLFTTHNISEKQMPQSTQPAKSRIRNRLGRGSQGSPLLIDP